ncbi:hypothetical protein BDF21DRAFT_346209 [Thamnidium elegans]|nr:hypothetical protein BDF21DRAFT_346209 [Thamnidium elegans]
MIIVNDKTLTLDDFIQLQALLNYEHAERDRHIRECQSNKEPIIYIQPATPPRYVQFRRDINPQASLQSSLERARLAEALMRLKWLKDQYRRQRALEVQLYLENYRRQALIRSVLEEEEERYYRQCIAAAVEKARIQLQPVEGYRQNDEGYDTSRTERLENLLQYIFDHQNLKEVGYEKEVPTEEEQTKNMAQVWKFLSDQRENEDNDEHMSSDQEYEGEYDDDEDDSEDDDIDEGGYEEEAKPKETEFPPIQDHVLPLQKLIQRLASEPVLIGEQRTEFSDEPKPSGIWAKEVPAKKSPTKKSPTLVPVSTNTSKTAFLPQHIFTEAEPTPTLENMPNTPLGAQEEEEQEQQGFEHFVNTVAAEQKNEEVPTDPRKVKMYQELEKIADLLSDPESDIVKRWQFILQGGKDGKQRLDFSKQKEGTLLLSASTPFNRQFLGSEDELLRTMLRLDAVDSFGDASIREERKKLVKKCESMLEDLDYYKQSQWEKAMIKNK